MRLLKVLGLLSSLLTCFCGSYNGELVIGKESKESQKAVVSINLVDSQNNLSDLKVERSTTSFEFSGGKELKLLESVIDGEKLSILVNGKNIDTDAALNKDKTRIVKTFVLKNDTEDCETPFPFLNLVGSEQANSALELNIVVKCTPWAPNLGHPIKFKSIDNKPSELTYTIENNEKETAPSTKITKESVFEFLHKKKGNVII